MTAFAYFTSAYDFAPGGGGPLRADHQPAYQTVKISGKIMPVDGPYSIGFFVENLTNERYYDFRFTTAPFGAMQYIARPRTYGVSVGVEF